jgi:hypothetical protein
MSFLSRIMNAQFAFSGEEEEYRDVEDTDDDDSDDHSPDAGIRTPRISPPIELEDVGSGNISVTVNHPPPSGPVQATIPRSVLVRMMEEDEEKLAGTFLAGVTLEDVDIIRRYLGRDRPHPPDPCRHTDVSTLYNNGVTHYRCNICMKYIARSQQGVWFIIDPPPPDPDRPPPPRDVFDLPYLGSTGVTVIPSPSPCPHTNRTWAVSSPTDVTGYVRCNACLERLCLSIDTGQWVIPAPGN